MMMKFNKIYIIALLVAFVIPNFAFAIQEVKEQDGNSIKTNKVFQYRKRTKEKKQQKKVDDIFEPPLFTNDVHSTFSLDDCIKLSLKYNPSIISSYFNEEIYKTKIGQAWSNYFPSLGAGVQVSREHQNYSEGTSNLGYSGNYNMGLFPVASGSMLLFDFGKTKAVADAAKRTYESKKFDTQESINALIYDVKGTYYNILFAKEQVKVYEDTVKDYQLQLKQAWGFYNIGKKPKLDVVTADYNLGKAELNLVKAKNILEVAYVKLSQSMGMPEYSNYEITDIFSLKKYDVTLENALETAYEVRPELLSADKKMQAAKKNWLAAKRNFTPDLGAFASYSNGRGSEYNLSSGNIGLGLNYSSLNIMLVKKQMDEAKATYQKYLADYKNTKQNVYLNVKKTYLELKTAEDSIKTAKLALDQAKEQYRQVTGRYKAGVGDAIELKDGENTYLNARLDFYNTLLNYHTTAAKLEMIVGIPIKLSENDLL